MRYTIWETLQGIAVPKESVLIHGGANVANNNFMTPKGVMTRVTDEQMDVLNQCPAFKIHREGGYIRVEDAPYGVDEVAEEMTPKDGAAPITAEDYEAQDIKPPTSGSIEEDKESKTDFQTAVRPGLAPTQIAGQRGDDDSDDSVSRDSSNGGSKFEKPAKATRGRRGRPSSRN